MSLTDDERAQIAFHLGYEETPPYSDYVVLYLHPAMNRANDIASTLTSVRARLTECNAAWSKYTKSLTKQELDQVKDIRFSKIGELRLLRTHRTLARRLARCLNVRTNYITSGGIKYR